MFPDGAPTIRFPPCTQGAQARLCRRPNTSLWDRLREDDAPPFCATPLRQAQGAALRRAILTMDRSSSRPRASDLAPLRREARDLQCLGLNWPARPEDIDEETSPAGID